MAEVYINSSSPITHQIFWNGIASDVDSALPIVKIYDITEDVLVSPPINPSTILATITSTKDETNVGLYSVQVPYNLTSRNRTLKFRWEYIVSGTPVVKEHEVFVVTPYTDLTQSAEELGLSIDNTDPNFVSYKELKLAEKYARKIIEDYTGQEFYLYEDVFTILGSDSDILPLPYKLHTLHSLYSNDILLIDNLASPAVNNWNYDTQVSETGFGIRVNRATMLDNTVYTANGMVPPSINDTYYGVFRNNVAYKVSGRFGWEKVPDNVELACIELMKDYFAKDKIWKNKYIKNIQTFDWQFEYDGGATRGTGNLYADQLLSSYILSNMVVI